MIKTLCDTWLLADPLVLGDRLSMANSVELRTPFLVHQLVELAISTNKKYIRTFRKDPKADLKEFLKNYLPKEILNQPKQRFTPPAMDWLVGVYKRYNHLLWNGYLVQNKYISRFDLVKILISLKPFRRN